MLNNTQDTKNQNSHHKHVTDMPQKETRANVQQMNGKTEPSLRRLELIPMGMAIHCDIILVM